MNYWLRLRSKLTLSQKLVVAIPYTWLLILCLIPFFIVLKISFAEQETAIPPYSPLISYDAEMSRATIQLSMANYQDIFSGFMHTIKSSYNPFQLLVNITKSTSLEHWFIDWSLINDPLDNGSSAYQNIYLKTYIASFITAITTTFLCLIIGFPMAYGIARAQARYRNMLLLAVMLPFWTSFLLRVYAWMGLLSTNGIINNFLAHFGIAPLDMFYNTFSLLLIMVYAYLPFMILPLYTQLVKLDNSLLEAAYDLGATPIKAFWSVTWPLARAGVIAGSMLVFIPAVGEFVIPELAGSPENYMIGKALWAAFFDQHNWPLASALSVIIVLLLVIPMTLFQRYETRQIERKSHA